MITHTKDLCKNIGFPDSGFTLAFRLGNQAEDKIKPLKIIMKNKRHRKNILDNATKIKSLSDTIFGKCIIVKELTVRQREEHK